MIGMSIRSEGEVVLVKMVRMLIQVPESLKAKLDALRDQGTSASGFIRCSWSGTSSRLRPRGGRDGEQWA